MVIISLFKGKIFETCKSLESNCLYGVQCLADLNLRQTYIAGQSYSGDCELGGGLLS